MLKPVVAVAALLLISAGPTAQAQVVPPAPALTLDHAGIQAADLDRSIGFLTRMFGLREVPSPFSHGAARGIELDGGRMLHIVANGRPDAPHNRWDHVGVGSG